MGTGLSVHWMGYHAGDEDFEAFRRWQPPTFKVMQDQWSSAQTMERLYRDMPGTLFLIRDVPMSSQHGDMHRDPIGTGERHAREWAEKIERHFRHIPGFDPARNLFLNINEPIAMTPQATGEIVAYNAAYLNALTTRGLRGGALNLSVGWPANTGPDTPVNWEPWTAVEVAARQGNHVIILHEYWAAWNGVNYNWGWWVDRLGQCPWDVPLIVGEAGVDNYVDPEWAANHFDEHRRGWAGYIGAEEYISQLERVAAIYDADPRIIGWMPFSYDFAHPWASFNIRDIRGPILDLVDRLRAATRPALAFPRYPSGVTPPAPPAPPEPPVEPPPPPIVEPEPEPGGFAVGPGVLRAMAEREDAPLSDEMYLGRAGAQVSITAGHRGLYITTESDGWVTRVGEWDEVEAPEPPPAPPVALPAEPSERFVVLARARYGDKFQDLRESLPRHESLTFPRMDSRRAEFIAIHHTASGITTSYQRVAEYHVNEREWAGIGYHVMLRKAPSGWEFALVGDLDTQRAHVRGRNDEALGVVVAGDYETRILDAEPLALLQGVVALLDEVYGHEKEIRGHGIPSDAAILPGHTRCPGSALAAVISRGLRERPARAA